MIATIDEGRRDLQQLAFRYEERLRQVEAQKDREISFLASQVALAEENLREVRRRHEVEIRRLTAELGEERRQANAERFHASSLEVSFEQLRQDRRRQLAEGDTTSAELDVAKTEIGQLRQHIDRLAQELGARQHASSELVGEVHRLQQWHLQHLQQQQLQLQEHEAHELLEQQQVQQPQRRTSPRSGRHHHSSRPPTDSDQLFDEGYKHQSMSQPSHASNKQLSGGPGAGLGQFLDEGASHVAGNHQNSQERRRRSSKDGHHGHSSRRGSKAAARSPTL